MAHVPGPHPARVGHPPGRVPGAHGGTRRRHAHGVDRQRHPPAGVRERCPTGSPRAVCPTPTGSWSRGSSCRSNHGLDDDDIEYLCVTAGRFLQEHGYDRRRGCRHERTLRRDGGPSSPARAAASARASPSGSRPRARRWRSSPAPSTRTRRLPGSLNETAERLRAYGNPVAIVAADLTDGDDRARIVPEAVEHARRSDRRAREQRGRRDVRAAVGDAAEAPAHHLRGERARAARPRAGRAARDARAGRGVDRQRVERDRQARSPGRRSRWRASPPPPACTARRRRRSTARPTRSRTSCGAPGSGSTPSSRAPRS